MSAAWRDEVFGIALCFRDHHLDVTNMGEGTKGSV